MSAVKVRGACKQYGRGDNAHAVLDGLNMTVEKGTIYGLLGASGCGKTTLLTCIVGRRRLGSGDIWVLGGKPGSRGSGVPGPRLGYMPQDLSLLREFSIRDAMEHFAWIYGLPASKFEERLEFLTKLLDLPPVNRFVKNLSGGQQRRVSLAVTLVHEPELLILDEPTVGLDPVLRQNIWDHLTEIASQGKTIIITTHYIEEATQANKIGLMRNGKLLAEGPPEELMRRFECNTVEDVFLFLSARQEANVLPDSPSIEAPVVQHNGIELRTWDKTQVPESEESFPSSPAQPSGLMASLRGKVIFKNSGHAKALLSKNFYRIIRHPGAILFIFLFPMLEICAFYLSVGGWPQGLKLAVVNEELGNLSSCSQLSESLGSDYGSKGTFTEEGLSVCIMRGLSCQYLEILNDSVAEKVLYKSLDEAISDAKRGHVLGYLYFAANFSESFEERIHAGSDSSNETLAASEIVIHMDMSLRQSALLVEQKLRETYDNFVKMAMKECGVSERVASIPLNLHSPVYGQKSIDYQLFMTPGVVVTMIFFISVGVTAMTIVVERLDGIWDRTLCAGVSSQEILLSHIILETFVILLQTGEVFLFVFYIFNIPCLGSLFHIMVLLFLQGFAGMCGGFLVSVSCSTITASNFVSMGSFYPILILSGLMWPIEGMPTILRVISIALPTTLATTAMRNIMERGWGMFENQVYQGYLVSIVWIILFSTMSLLVVRRKK